MKYFFICAGFLFTSSLFAQQTNVHITSSDGIGVNIAAPTKYFQLEVPDTYLNNGLYTKINYSGLVDIRAIEGISEPNPGYGIGGYFTGGFKGLHARANGGAYDGNGFALYGLYAESIGTAGTRIGLYSRASGGTLNLAARFGSGDVEIQNKLRVNTTNQNGIVHITSNDNTGSNATAIRIESTNSGTENTYGTLVSASNSSTGDVFGYYSTVSAAGANSRAYGIFANAPDPEDYALFGIGNTYVSGYLRVGTTTNPYSGQYKVVVDGKILTEEVRVQNSSGWPDYVFDEHYDLKSLPEIEQFIAQNHHLPNIPSAQVIAENGIALGDMQIRMMEKIEELTLHIIRQQKEMDALKNQIKLLSK
jgi:hypothetical protein